MEIIISCQVRLPCFSDSPDFTPPLLSPSSPPRPVVLVRLESYTTPSEAPLLTVTGALGESGVDTQDSCTSVEKTTLSVVP